MKRLPDLEAWPVAVGNPEVMFHSLIGWLVGTGVGLVIAKFALKNPALKPDQRKQAKLLAFGIVLLLVFLAALSFRGYLWSGIYSAPIVTDSNGFYSAQNNWLIVAGTVGDKLTLSGQDKGYSVYAEYSGSGSTRSLRNFNGEKDLEVILSDGTRITFSSFGLPQETWNWPSESSVTFLKPGDPVVVEAVFSEFQNSKTNEKGYATRDVEFIYHGTPETFSDSWLAKQGKLGGYLDLAISILSVFSIIAILGLVMKSGKAPEPDPER